MKKLLQILIVMATLMPLAGCRSHKQVTSETLQQEEATWQNVQMPVTITLLKPQKMSISGTATLVRGEYVYISLRFFGFEVGQVNLTPEEADVVLKQPQKLWVSTPTGERLARLGMSFTQLQEILLGGEHPKVPDGLNVQFGGTSDKPEVTVSGKLKGKDLEVMLTWNLASAKWNQESPKAFEQPGAGYKKMTAEEALSKIVVK